VTAGGLVKVNITGGTRHQSHSPASIHGIRPGKQASTIQTTNEHVSVSKPAGPQYSIAESQPYNTAGQKKKLNLVAQSLNVKRQTYFKKQSFGG